MQSYLKIAALGVDPSPIDIVFVSAMLTVYIFMIVSGAVSFLLIGCVIGTFIENSNKSLKGLTTIDSSVLQDCQNVLNTYRKLKNVLSLPLLLLFSPTTLATINCIYFTITIFTHQGLSVSSFIFLNITINYCIPPVYLALVADDCYEHLQDLYCEIG